jgi:hypothetical protein
MEALNNRAVAFYKKNKTEIAISELKKILKIDYDYVAAHHNILKLTMNPPVYSSFWSYWMDSLPKKIFAWLLITLISGILLSIVIVPGVQSIIYSNNNINALNNSIVSTKNITNETKPLSGNQSNEIPVFPLICLAVAVLLLLSPMIRSAKIGATSFELSMVDRNPDKQLELEFIER